jgi:hypothetical protein
MTEEFHDRWILELRGSPVVSIVVSRDFDRHETALVLEYDSLLEIKGQAFLTQGASSAPGAVRLPDEEWQGLVGATVVSAVAFKSGALRVVFSTGHHMNVPSQGSDVVIHIRRLGRFDWFYHDGVGVMRVFGTPTS